MLLPAGIGSCLETHSIVLVSLCCYELYIWYIIDFSEVLVSLCCYSSLNRICERNLPRFSFFVLLPSVSRRSCNGVVVLVSLCCYWHEPQNIEFAKLNVLVSLCCYTTTSRNHHNCTAGFSFFVLLRLIIEAYDEAYDVLVSLCCYS